MAHPLGRFLEKYKRWGFSLVPIKYRDKKPLVAWEKYQTQRADNAQLLEWFGGELKNIAVICGKVSNNLVVLDFDTEKLFQEYAEVWSQLQGTSIYKSTPVARTGGQGYHVFLRVKNLPALYHPAGEERSKTPDIQSEKGYVLLPPSLHPSGKRYQWVNPEITEIREVEALDDVGIRNIPLTGEETPRKTAKHPFTTKGESFNETAVQKLLANCAFIKHCQEDAENLSEEHWWSMVHQLTTFGDAGKRKIHELSRPYRKVGEDGKIREYSEKETDRKIQYALKAYEKGVGTHTCNYIKESLGFSCPDKCQAPSLEVSSPAGMASKLASMEIAQRRTGGFSTTTTKSGKTDIKVSCPRLAEEIMNDYTFKTFRDTEEILVYDQGYYKPQGEKLIKEQVRHRLLEFTTAHRVNEVVEYIRIATFEDRENFNQDPWVLNLENGLLDLRTMQLHPHSPDFLSTIRIPVAYDSRQECPAIDRFLQQTLKPEDIPIVEELIGYCLIPSHHIHRAFLFVGDGANGKSTMIELIRRFLGKGNCTSLALQTLENNRFATSQLFGKLANMYADIPSNALNHTGTFKMLTGGDTVGGEKKFGGCFFFNNHAKLVFSSNKPPQVRGEDSYAFWRRWIIINFPYQFDGEKADKRILEKLTTKTELSGLLNKALKGIKRLVENQDFSYSPGADEVADLYLKASDPIYAFITERCVLDQSEWTSKDDLYDAYKKYTHDSRIPTLGKESFGRALRNSPIASSIKAERRRIGGELVHGWKGIAVVHS